jgi:hypothetical protein
VRAGGSYKSASPEGKINYEKTLTDRMKSSLAAGDGYGAISSSRNKQNK